MTALPYDPTFPFLEHSHWGNYAEIPAELIAKYGTYRAARAAMRFDPYESPQMESPNFTAAYYKTKEGKEARKEWYKQKAILERQKELERRGRFVVHNPMGTEAMWQAMEADRRASVEAKRAHRRAARATQKGGRRRKHRKTHRRRA